MASGNSSRRSFLPDPVSHQPVVPFQRILDVLGIAAGDLQGDSVVVRAQGLRCLLRAFARSQPFDHAFYADHYPDIEAARLAGRFASLHDHFVNCGFFEGRIPSSPPFDPVWYASFYTDLADTISPADMAGLWNHFLGAGLAEGRAGTRAALGAADPLADDAEP